VASCKISLYAIDINTYCVIIPYSAGERESTGNCPGRSQIHGRAISLRFLGIFLRGLRLEVSVWVF
jgi:hypothetical protein